MDSLRADLERKGNEMTMLRKSLVDATNTVRELEPLAHNYATELSLDWERRKVDRLQREVRSERKKVECLRGTVMRLEEELRMERGRAKRLEEQLRTESEYVGTLDAEISRLERELEEKRDADQKIDIVESIEVEELPKDEAESQHATTKIENGIDGRSAEIDESPACSNDAELLQVKVEKEVVEAELKQTRLQMERLTIDKDEVDAKIGQVALENLKLKETLGTKEKELAELHSRYHDNDVDFATLQLTDGRNNDSAMTALKTQLIYADAVIGAAIQGRSNAKDTQLADAPERLAIRNDLWKMTDFEIASGMKGMQMDESGKTEKTMKDMKERGTMYSRVGLQASSLNRDNLDALRARLGL